MQNNFNEENIIEYLVAHPDFLNRHPNLYEILESPKREFKGAVFQSKIVDFQQSMIEKMRLKHQITEESYDEYKRNLVITKQIIDACVSLIAPKNIPEFIKVISQDWRKIFEVDSIIYAKESPALNENFREFEVKKGKILQIFGGDSQQFYVGRVIPEYEWIFASSSIAINSCALVRLNIANCDEFAMVGFGSGDKNFYQAQMATNYLEFLQNTLQVSFNKCYTA